MTKVLVANTEELGFAGERIDRYLHGKFPQLSRNFFTDQCRAGRVTADGKVSAPGQILRGGEELALNFELEPVTARPELGRTYPLQPCFNDEHLFVIEKPRAMPSITLRQDDPVTAADCLAGLDDRCITAGEDPREAGLIHRLDNFSSGLLVAAKSRKAWLALRAQLAAGEIEKTYRVLVEGIVPEGTLTLKLYLRPSGKVVRISAQPAEGFELTESAITRVRTSEAGISVADVRVPNAKRHQVRAHLAFFGHPLIGDELYGSAKGLGDFLSHPEAGFLLHASAIRFRHPLSGEVLSFQSGHPLFKEIA